MDDDSYTQSKEKPTSKYRKFFMLKLQESIQHRWITLWCLYSWVCMSKMR